MCIYIYVCVRVVCVCTHSHVKKLGRPMKAFFIFEAFLICGYLISISTILRDYSEISKQSNIINLL